MGGGQVQREQPVQSQPMLCQSAQLVVGAARIKSSQVLSATQVAVHPLGEVGGGRDGGRGGGGAGGGEDSSGAAPQ